MNVSLPNYPSIYSSDTDVIYTFSESGTTKMRVHFSSDSSVTGSGFNIDAAEFE